MTSFYFYKKHLIGNRLGACLLSVWMGLSMVACTKTAEEQAAAEGGEEFSNTHSVIECFENLKNDKDTQLLKKIVKNKEKIKNLIESKSFLEDMCWQVFVAIWTYLSKVEVEDYEPMRALLDLVDSSGKQGVLKSKSQLSGYGDPRLREMKFIYIEVMESMRSGIFYQNKDNCFKNCDYIQRRFLSIKKNIFQFIGFKKCLIVNEDLIRSWLNVQTELSLERGLIKKEKDELEKKIREELEDLEIDQCDDYHRYRFDEDYPQWGEYKYV